MTLTGWQPADAPLYDPRDDHDACGVGFLADLDGRHAGRLVPMALEALAALEHRGARAADDRTGDGAGLLLPLTRPLLARILEPIRTARGSDRYAVGMCFLPSEPAAAAEAECLVADQLTARGLTVLGWREVPVDATLLAGRRADATPSFRQVVVVAPRRVRHLTFARRLALARRGIERAAAGTPGMEQLTVVSLSDRTIVYKGLFVGDELGRFYQDLRAPELRPRQVVFHQRYSTNTFPSWRLAQPFRYLAHNGEINTVRANRAAMHGRRHDLGGGTWSRQLAALGPLISPDGSDSLSLDEALELLVLAGRPLDEALVELVPPAVRLSDTDAADAAEPHAASEPWDGPAALVFADGTRVGCLLDRNGLRPAACTVTSDGLVVVSSEAGSVSLPAGRIEGLHRLGPGELVVADVRSGRLEGPMTAKRTGSRPELMAPIAVGAQAGIPRIAPQAGDDRLRVAVGLDGEVVRQVIRPMAIEGREAIWSMGDDTPIAPLARRPRRVSAFLRQAFAQVTNPAIDPERERIVMSLAMAIGRQPRLLAAQPSTGRSVLVPRPILDGEGWKRLVRPGAGWRTAVLDATWPAARGPRGLATALDRLARQARAARRRGCVLVSVSDRAVRQDRVAIPPVLAVGRVHQALVADGHRSRCDVVVEAAECFDVHEVAMLLAVGASAVHPWLMLELAAEVAGSRGGETLSPEAARDNVRAALEHGLRKVLARMGISTLASYRGGQLFDTLGIQPALADACFPSAGGWPGRLGTAEIGRMVLERHRRGYGATDAVLDDPGLIRFRGSGEAHAFAPRVVKAIQGLVTAADGEGATALATYRAAVSEQQPRQPRELLGLRSAGPPLPLSRVEPARLVARRFVSAAMSLGALSPEAHQALAIGMERLGGSSNSGEGGEDPTWYAGPPNGDRRDAAIKQVASARFGVTAEYLARAEQLEIKIAQGSKPGEGGQLPGRKATAFIAALRRGQPGMTMISPPPHHDIYSIEDLAQLITDLRAVNPAARIGVKLVAGAGIGTIAAGVAKAHADYILVSGHAGGTGASPLSSIKHAGLPWELGLAEVHQVLVRNRLRDRVALRVDGGLQTGRDVLVAALLGAEEFGFGTAALVALGCDMARQCHLDTCPTGIATQREDLRAKFTGRPDDVVAFFSAIAEDVRRELAALGLRRLADAVGRSDLLEIVAGYGEQPILDLERLTAAPAWSVPDVRRRPPKDAPLHPGRPVASRLESDIVESALAEIENGRPYRLTAEVTTRERTVGARLAGALARRPEPRTLPHVTYELNGAAGQSLGSFAVAGMRIAVSGVANDYVGKGLSGGTVVVRPAAGSTAADPALVGNTCLYGATAGRLHVVGRSGMRFAVRNSGARAVVEGIGPHGCEYMTGGMVVVLGPVGANFGAGMTGGRAFVWDPHGTATQRLNGESVVGGALELADEGQLLELLVLHAEEGSRRAAALVDEWEAARHDFLAVTPRDAAALAGEALSLRDAPAEPARGQRARATAVGR